MQIASLKRHYLVAISQYGRDRTLSHYYHHNGSCSSNTHTAQLIAGDFESIQIPGIVRREEKKKLPGMIPVGFSSPFLEDGGRIRLPAFVYPEDIVAMTSPYDLTKRDFKTRTTCLMVLEKLKNIAEKLGIKLGVWGSAGLEIYTSLNYTHPQSDLDLLVAMSDLKTLQKFFQIGIEFYQQHGCRIDMEIDLPGGYGVQAAELFSETDPVLGKGIDDIIYISKNNIASYFF